MYSGGEALQSLYFQIAIPPSRHSKSQLGAISAVPGQRHEPQEDKRSGLGIWGRKGNLGLVDAPKFRRLLPVGGHSRGAVREAVWSPGYGISSFEGFPGFFDTHIHRRSMET